MARPTLSKKLLLMIGLLSFPLLGVLIRLLTGSKLYSDTIFVAEGSYTNQGSPEVIDHLNQHCKHRVGSESSYHSYMRFCEIREGSYKQWCSGDGYSTACSKPKTISHS